jgi:thiosulfate dehydrogenase [quinone] large subunit
MLDRSLTHTVRKAFAMATTNIPLRTELHETAAPPRSGVFSPRWLHGAAIVRILFGVLWGIDAVFKWLPGFINGQTLGDELGAYQKVDIPIIHEYLVFVNSVGTANPAGFAVFIAIVETLVAIALITGTFSNVAFIGSALLSFGIWSGAEGFHLPWTKPGMTDLGPSVGYIFASLALFFALAGSTWAVDTWLRPKLGRWSWLASPAAPTLSPATLSPAVSR